MTLLHVVILHSLIRLILGLVQDGTLYWVSETKVVIL